KSLSHQMAAHELELIARLQGHASRTGTRLRVGYPFAVSHNDAKPVYVHSKTIVVDDRFLSIGSANLAMRAFRVDTELNLTLEASSPAEHSYIRRIAQQILQHWNLAHQPRRG